MQFYTSLSLSLFRIPARLLRLFGLRDALASLRLHAIFNNILFNWEIIITLHLSSSSYA